MDLRVNPDDFLAHIAVLAEDAMGGRGIGSRGIDQAAAYIAGQFALLGVQPGGENGTYFQEFDVATGGALADEPNFAVHGIGSSPVRGTDYIPFGFSGGDAFDGEVVFVGYGITNPDENHDDYAGIDVTGKVALMLRREPPSWGGEGQTTRLATFQNKVYTAKEKGAVAVLVVNRVEDAGRSAHAIWQSASRLRHTGLSCDTSTRDEHAQRRGIPTPRRSAIRRRTVDRMSRPC